MTRRAFDRFMVMVEIAGNPKVARLSDAEFRCLVTGVWPLAAKATPRGALRVATHAAEDADVAHQARTSVAVARRTLEKLRGLGMLERDDDLGCEVVHDWDDVNPSPKPSDTPEARRARKQAQRERDRGVTPEARHADVTRDPSREVEVEVEELPPNPPHEGGAALWLAITERVRPSVPATSFAAYIETVEPVSYDGKTLEVRAPASQWIRERFAPLFAKTASEVEGHDVLVVVAESDDERQARAKSERRSRRGLGAAA